MFLQTPPDPSPPANDVFNLPHGITVAEAQDLVCVADRENGRIQCFHLDGTFSPSIKPPQFGPKVYGVEYCSDQGMLSVVCRCHWSYCVFLAVQYNEYCRSHSRAITKKNNNIEIIKILKSNINTNKNISQSTVRKKMRWWNGGCVSSLLSQLLHMIYMYWVCHDTVEL